MLQARARGISGMVAMVQCTVAVLFVWKALEALSGRELPAGWFGLHAWPWVLGILFAGLWRCARTPGGHHPGVRESFERAFTAMVVAGVVWLDRGFGCSIPVPAETVWLSGGIFVVLASLHWALPRVLEPLFFSSDHRLRTVLIGPARGVFELWEWFQKQAALGFQPVGWLHADPAGQAFEAGLPWLGTPLDAGEVVTRERVQHLVLVGGATEEEVSQWSRRAEAWGVRFTVAQSGAHEDAALKWEAREDWVFGPTYREPLQSPLNRFLKRGLDLVVAVPAVLFALLPVAVVTWAMQRKQSKGPLFFRQWRHGRANAAFRVWKLRTMHCGTEALESKQAVAGDARVYPFGAWLRRHSLDELPQFLNVLTGEMSVVGPRPHFVEHTKVFESQRRYHIRSFVKPGVTGLAQVNGCRGEVEHPSELEQRIAWDIAYVERWSLLLDCMLILRTIRTVLFPGRKAV